MELFWLLLLDLRHYFGDFFFKSFGGRENIATFASQLSNRHGAIAQLVEQRTENPCVPGSIPGGTTSEPSA